MSHAKTYFENKEKGVYGNKGAIEFFPLEVFFKDDTNVTIYDNKGKIVCTVKGLTLRDRIFDPINGRLNRVIVTDGV